VTFDVVFALDDSSNVPDNLWSAMLSLMSSYVDRFRVGLGNVRVGVVRYSDRATIAFDLNEYRSGTAVKTAISQLQHLSTSSQRNLAHAFQITLAHLLVRGQRYFAAQVRTAFISFDRQCSSVSYARCNYLTFVFFLKIH